MDKTKKQTHPALPLAMRHIFKTSSDEFIRPVMLKFFSINLFGILLIKINMTFIIYVQDLPKVSTEPKISCIKFSYTCKHSTAKLIFNKKFRFVIKIIHNFFPQRCTGKSEFHWMQNIISTSHSQHSSIHTCNL